MSPYREHTRDLPRKMAESMIRSRKMLDPASNTIVEIFELGLPKLLSELGSPKHLLEVGLV